MNPTSPEKREKIIKLWFEEGKTGKEIAEIENTSEANVSAIINSLPKYFQRARDLAVKCRKNNKTLDDALKGINIVLQIEALGLTTDEGQNLIEAFKKISSDTQYQPKLLIHAYTKLVELVQQTGKQYPDALKHFEKLNLNAQELAKRNKTLNQENDQIKNETINNATIREQALKKAKVTEKEITQVNKLKSELQYYGIDLFNVEQLLDFLCNMNDAGINPRNFVTFTKEIGSIKQHLLDLDDQKKTRIEAIDLANREIDLIKTNRDVFMTKANNEKKTTQEAVAKENSNLKKVKDEVDSANFKLSNLRIAIQNAETIQQKAIEETEKTLGIRNYALEHQRAMAELETKHQLLDDEVKKEQSKIAFATVITDFLTTQSDNLFDLFNAEVQRLKEIRENPRSPLKLALPELTDVIRSRALEAINGNPRFPLWNNLMAENQRLFTENLQLKQKIDSLETEKRRKTTS